MSIQNRLRQNVPLAPLTTMGVGGPAQYFLSCTSVEEIREALQWANEKKLPVHILGGGSNTLFADEGFAGLVLHIALNGVTLQEDGNVEAAAGEHWDTLVAHCVEHNLAGIECLSGIPGMVGATPIQNVGAYGQEVADTIASVRVLNTQTLKEEVFANNDCTFSYRSSRFKAEDAGRFIVTHVTYQLVPEGKPTIKYAQLSDRLAEEGKKTPTLADVRAAVIAIRKAKSMVIDPSDPDTRSCGSFFENVTLSPHAFAAFQEQCKHAGITEDIPSFTLPSGIRIPSAWLIQKAGFTKGMTENGIGISRHHILALVNRGGTTAGLLHFATRIQQAVKEKFGIEMKREPVVAG